MIETPLEGGVYYPRMARPYSHKHKESPGWNPEDEEKASQHDKTVIVAENAGQLHNLKEHLEVISKVIYPCEDNGDAFGHEIRNVLIVSCTEVEAQWRGVMRDGFCFEKKDGEDMATRVQYKELLEPLRLHQYCVRFPYFPTLREISPFKDWKSEGKLDWYDAYNKVKHDREKNFRQAKLIHAFEAAAAYFVMLCAQHGWEVAARPDEAKTKFFYLKAAPTWEKDYCYKPLTIGEELVFNKRKKFFVKDKAKAVEERSPPLVVAKDTQPKLLQLYAHDS
jgi:hypothetical protein